MDFQGKVIADMVLPAPRTLPQIMQEVASLQTNAVLRSDISSLILTAVHEMLKIDFRSLEPFPGIHNPPYQNQELK